MRAGTRRLTGLLAATVVLSVAATATAAADVPPDATPFGLANAVSGSQLAVPSMSTDNGTPVLQRRYPWQLEPFSTDAQWTLVQTGDGYEIHNVNSGKCLEIADSRTDDGAPAQQWDCVGIPTQRWDIEPGTSPIYENAVLLVNRNSGKCLEIADSRTDDDAPAQQWQCVGVENQNWQFTATHQPMA